MSLTAEASHDANSFFSTSLAESDPAVFGPIEEEFARQQGQIELIASENIVSRAVLEAQGSVLTNKYAEGYPGKRYYGGCEFVDKVEALALERARALFGCAWANVQPHSGSQANQAVFMALMKPGDTFMGMDLAAGGHLTHGKSINQSGKWFSPVAYTVRTQDQLIDYDALAELALEHKPKVIIAGGSAYSREIDFARFREVADSVGAKLMVDMAHFAGLVAGGVFPSPLPHAHVVTTTTHKTLRGPRGGMILSNDLKLGKKLDSAVFPGLQGGPLMHVIAAKAVAFGEALRPEFKLYARDVIANARALAESLAVARSVHRLRRHRQPPDAGRPARQGRHRHGRRGEPGAGRTSPATRTASRSIPRRRRSPPACVWARPPAPRAASASPSSAASASSSPRWSTASPPTGRRATPRSRPMSAARSAT